MFGRGSGADWKKALGAEKPGGEATKGPKRRFGPALPEDLKKGTTKAPPAAEKAALTEDDLRLKYQEISLLQDSQIEAIKRKDWKEAREMAGRMPKMDELLPDRFDKASPLNNVANELFELYLKKKDEIADAMLVSPGAPVSIRIGKEVRATSLVEPKPEEPDKWSLKEAFDVKGQRISYLTEAEIRQIHKEKLSGESILELRKEARRMAATEFKKIMDGLKTKLGAVENKITDAIKRLRDWQDPETVKAEVETVNKEYQDFWNSVSDKIATNHEAVAIADRFGKRNEEFKAEYEKAVARIAEKASWSDEKLRQEFGPAFEQLGQMAQALEAEDFAQFRALGQKDFKIPDIKNIPPEFHAAHENLLKQVLSEKNELERKYFEKREPKLNELRQKVAETRGKMEEVGTIKKIFSKFVGQDTTKKLEEEYKKIYEEYEKLRGEVVGEDVERALAEIKKLNEARLVPLAITAEKNGVEKAAEKISWAWRGLGEMNLYKAYRSVFKGDIDSKFVKWGLRTLSVRTGLSAVALGSTFGWSFAAWKAGQVAGMGGWAALAGKRIMGSAGGTVGFSDLIRNVSLGRKEKKLASTLDEIFKKKDVNSVKEDELSAALADFEIVRKMEGVRPADDPRYNQLVDLLHQKLEAQAQKTKDPKAFIEKLYKESEDRSDDVLEGMGKIQKRAAWAGVAGLAFGSGAAQKIMDLMWPDHWKLIPTRSVKAAGTAVAASEPKPEIDPEMQKEIEKVLGKRLPKFSPDALTPRPAVAEVAGEVKPQVPGAAAASEAARAAGAAGRTELLHGGKLTGAFIEMKGDHMVLHAGKRGIEGALLDVKTAQPEQYRAMIEWIKSQDPKGQNLSDGALIHRHVIKFAEAHEGEGFEIGSGAKDLNKILAAQMEISKNGSVQIDADSIEFMKGKLPVEAGEAVRDAVEVSVAERAEIIEPIPSQLPDKLDVDQTEPATAESAGDGSAPKSGETLRAEQMIQEAQRIKAESAERLHELREEITNMRERSSAHVEPPPRVRLKDVLQKQPEDMKPALLTIREDFEGVSSQLGQVFGEQAKYQEFMRNVLHLNARELNLVADKNVEDFLRSFMKGTDEFKVRYQGLGERIAEVIEGGQHGSRDEI